MCIRDSTEAYVQLRLYHHAGLADLQFIRQQLTVNDRARAGKLAAEQLCKLSLLIEALVLHAVADADYRLAACDVKLGVKVVGLVLQQLRADLLLV